MLYKIKKVFVSLSVFFIIFSSSCSQGEEVRLNKIYGEDASYFLALKALKEKNSEKANKLFERCAKKGSSEPARRSLEQLCLTGDVQQRIKRCGELLEKFNDDKARIFACREFLLNKEYALVIAATEDIDLATAGNSLVKMRLEAMLKKNDSRYNQTLYEWFTRRRISTIHYDFYRETARDELEEVITENNISPASEFEVNLSFIQQFRIAIYRGNYNAAYEMLDQIRTLTLIQRKVPLTYQLVADMGRACVNGSIDNISNARRFIELSERTYFEDIEEIKYYALIYAGLLYNKNDNYRRRALKTFEEAITLSNSDEEYDQALWYYLQSCLKISTDEAVNGIEKYCANWHDPAYFDDFFDSLSVLLFSGGKWESFPKIFSLIKNCASPATLSKYAYLSARIMQTQIKDASRNEIQAAFEEAANCDTGTYVYYKLLAAKQLGLTSSDGIERLFFTKKPETGIQNSEEEADDRALSARKLLLGYADFGLGEMIYDEWLSYFEEDKKLIDLASVTSLSTFLRKMDDGKNNFCSKALRMISRTANFDGREITREAFELLYPKNFSDEVTSASQEFEIDDYVMYALIRTESFFEPQIQSHAGASGLTQLMESTAQDVARKLKVDHYDLNDPATNIRFGTYYFSNMAHRLDNSHILALFAYNAGITTVRRWIRSSKIELDTHGSLSSDLFLETLPFSETRDYGRRVVSAAAMYAWLYQNKNPCDIISTMM